MMIETSNKPHSRETLKSCLHMNKNLCRKTKNVISFLVIINLLFLKVTSALNNANDDSTHHVCSLYLAPTSISSKEPKRLSMYAGRDFEANSIIGLQELAIPILDLELHNDIYSSRSTSTSTSDGAEGTSPDNVLDSNFFEQQSDFLWTGSTIGADFETLPNYHKFENQEDNNNNDIALDILVAIPGIGSLANQFLDFVNADYVDSNILLRSSPPSLSSTDNNTPFTPDRGAQTHYYNVTLQSNKFIPAGSEILINLGEPLPQSDPNDIRTNLRNKDYQNIDSLLQKIIHFIDTKYNYNNDRTPEQIHQLYHMFVHDLMPIIGISSESIHPDEYDEQKIKNFRRQVAHEIFPSTYDQAKDIIQNKRSVMSLTYPQIQKSISWLESNGQCMDYIQVKKSTVPNCRFGAFAKHFIPKGSLIAPSPLMRIDSKSWMDMKQTIKVVDEDSNKEFIALLEHVEDDEDEDYYDDEDEDYYDDDDDEDGEDKEDSEDEEEEDEEESYDDNVSDDDDDSTIVHKQLLVNYSFGHPDSSLLLYPYGMGVNYINHQSGANANAKIVWTSQSYHNNDLLSLSVSALNKLGEKSIVSLGFDIIATRDIQPNEEIFLDYGNEWDSKWNAHLENWNSDGLHKSNALDMNTEMKVNHSYFLTKAERQNNPKSQYPSNVSIICYIVSIGLRNDDTSPREIEGKAVYRFAQEEDLQLVINGNNVQPCEIIERTKISSTSFETLTENDDSEVEYEYTVELLNRVEVIKYVPQSVVQFVDNPYTSDLHSKLGFRQEIGIPDEIFPDAWRDLKH